ncbi:MAG: hypothetical protein H6621_02550 [Halobacteriovoraceae bacterium]|nr:hypothetical protein [Halobacteriovoraceae bacterium]MCB9093923.1 hypothetical protein [Halobacteriovoraceae bacterium]
MKYLILTLTFLGLHSALASSKVIIECEFLEPSYELYGLEGIRIVEEDQGYKMVLFPDIPELKTQQWPVLRKTVDNGIWYESFFNVEDLSEDTDYVTQLGLYHAVEEIGEDAFLGLPKLIGEDGNFLLDTDDIDISAMCVYR